MVQRLTFLPETAMPDARVLVTSRAIRAFGDGFVSVLLAVWLKEIGFASWQVGALTTTTLIGSAALTLGMGLVAWRWKRQRLLLGAALLVALTGLGFTLVHAFWPLLLVAFIGTLNPSSGDVSVFLPLEQSPLPRTVSDRERTSLFARYGFVATVSGRARRALRRGAGCRRRADLADAGAGADGHIRSLHAAGTDRAAALPATLASDRAE